MKKSLSLLLLFFISVIVFAQENGEVVRPGTSYRFIQHISKENSRMKRLGKAEFNEITGGNRVTVYAVTDTTVSFRYLPFVDENLDEKFGKGAIFSLPKSEFLKITKPVFKRFKGFQFGAYTVPFRLRGIESNEFDFESSLSLTGNMVAGIGSRKRRESIFDASFGIGLTGVTLNQSNSDSTVVTEERTANAFTISFGGVVKPSKFVNFGLFLGWDILGQKDRDTDWIYDRKRWIGLGLNISFNAISSDEPPKEQKN